MKKSQTLRVRCTCCEAVLTVDKVSGEVVYTEKPVKSTVSFEEAVNRVKKEKEMADERFQQAFAKESDRKRLVEQKFEELWKHQDELEEPVKDLDLD